MMEIGLPPALQPCAAAMRGAASSGAASRKRRRIVIMSSLALGAVRVQRLARDDDAIISEPHQVHRAGEIW